MKSQVSKHFLKVRSCQHRNLSYDTKHASCFSLCPCQHTHIAVTYLKTLLHRCTATLQQAYRMLATLDYRVDKTVAEHLHTRSQAHIIKANCSKHRQATHPRASSTGSGKYMLSLSLAVAALNCCLVTSRSMSAILAPGKLTLTTM
jgi:hypothetical protein